MYLINNVEVFLERVQGDLSDVFFQDRQKRIDESKDV